MFCLINITFIYNTLFKPNTQRYISILTARKYWRVYSVFDRDIIVNVMPQSYVRRSILRRDDARVMKRLLRLPVGSCRYEIFECLCIIGMCLLNSAGHIYPLFFFIDLHFKPCAFSAI